MSCPEIEVVYLPTLNQIAIFLRDLQKRVPAEDSHNIGLIVEFLAQIYNLLKTFDE